MFRPYTNPFLTQLISPHWLTAIAAWLFGLWYFCLRITGTDLSFIPGDLGDARFINFILEHGYQWTQNGFSDFWNGGFMYPFDRSIALSDSLLGLLPLYIPWRWLGNGPETAYQLWWLSLCSLNFWAAHLVFRKWLNKHTLSVILAWVFAFFIYNIGQLNYMQMMGRFVVPFIFYAAYRMVQTPGRKWLLSYSVTVVIQCYCVPYIAVYAFYFSLFLMALMIYLSGKKQVVRHYVGKHALRSTLTCLLIPAVIIYPLIHAHISISDITGYRHWGEVAPLLPRWESFFFPHKASDVWEWLHHLMLPPVENWWLHFIFPGLLPLSAAFLLPAYLYMKRKNSLPEFAFLLSLSILIWAIALLHLRADNGITLYGIIFYLPGFNSIRVPNRFMHVEIFLLLLALGYLLRRAKPIHLVPLAILCFLDQSFSIPYIPKENKQALIDRKTNLIEQLRGSKASNYTAFAYINPNQPVFVTHLDAMLAGQSLGLKTINGYSSYCPKDFSGFFTNASKEGLDKWMELANVDPNGILVLEEKISSP